MSPVLLSPVLLSPVLASLVLAPLASLVLAPLVLLSPALTPPVVPVVLTPLASLVLPEAVPLVLLSLALLASVLSPAESVAPGSVLELVGVDDPTVPVGSVSVAPLLALLVSLVAGGSPHPVAAQTITGTNHIRVRMFPRYPTRGAFHKPFGSPGWGHAEMDASALMIYGRARPGCAGVLASPTMVSADLLSGAATMAAVAADGATQGLVATEMATGRASGPEPVLERGATIGRYLILERLGSGGMGVVFLAYDPELDRKLALKLLHTGPAAHAEVGRVRLLREAQAMAKLTHPNVVAVHDVGTFAGQVFVAMDFVRGQTLGEPGLHTRDLGESGLDTRDLGELGLDTRDLGEPGLDTRTTSTPPLRGRIGVSRDQIQEE
nr:protein kinase [Nannocystis sp.]